MNIFFIVEANNTPPPLRLREHFKEKLAFISDASAKGGGGVDPPAASKKCKFFLKMNQMLS